ncbi:DoxX family protein [Hymenobacter sp. BT491]|uniref:DoxX family protein n=1 Tax=Hymenobacter sp. BT491 TaxID=2766779 RepID=UPI001653B9B3|nr:DoxX family protein [Hymenobacter sp. BT491]MBC6989111.1 DoxX family protein [Hymenobacter sp. BT491]
MKKLLFATAPFSSRLADVAWLLFRLHLGLSIAIGAGWSKLINLSTAQESAKLASGATALSPPDWFVQQVANLGFTYPSPYFWAWLATWGEFVGGLLVAVGLLTRWGGLQLAIQFLLIAFLWYDAPEPILGMYYQQLLFWAFVLVTTVGGGRYSLDNWLQHRSLAPAAIKVTAPQIALLALMVIGATGNALAQRAGATTSVAEFDKLLRNDWTGTLTYLDYRTQKPVTLPTTLSATQTAPRQLTLAFTYRESATRSVQGQDTLVFSADGREITWSSKLRVVAKTTSTPQGLHLVLEGPGMDDNKPCTIRKTIDLSEQHWSVVKEVKYQDGLQYFVRNLYQFEH